jgi:hypothetical protein
MASPKGHNAEFFGAVNSCGKTYSIWKTYDSALRERSEKSEKRDLNEDPKFDPCRPVKGSSISKCQNMFVNLGTRFYSPKGSPDG